MGEKYLPVVGRVRKLRPMEDQSAPIPEERTSELGGIIFSHLLRLCLGKGASRGARVGRVKSLDFIIILLPLEMHKD